MRIAYTVPPEEDALTLAQILRGPMGLSARQAREAKQAGVTVDGAPLFPSQRVGAGRTVFAQLQGYAASAPVPDAPPIDVLLEDDALLAVRKPAGLQCHPSASAPGGSDTLEARVQAYLRSPAHPVHRLDADTTGIVLFAKLPFAQANLQRQMRDGTFAKTYRAWVCGAPPADDGVIDAPIAPADPASFTRVVRADGQRAVSRYRVVQTLRAPDALSLVELSPETGRTHQLRVHMAHIGCPLLGDMRYGTDASRALSARLAVGHHQLSAVALRFAHPLTGKAVLVSCEADFAFDPGRL